VKLDIRWESLSRIVRDSKAPADFVSVLICKLGQKLLLVMEGRINKQMPASINVGSYSSEDIEMVYCHQSPPVPSRGNHRYQGFLLLQGGVEASGKLQPTASQFSKRRVDFSVTLV
jgi:hypothetical protein